MKDAEYWEALEARYFDGLTTEAEEEELRAHMSQKAAQGERNPAAALMAYAAVAKAERFRIRRRRVIRRVGWAAAACAIIAIAIGTLLPSQPEIEGYVMVNGKVVAQTDEALSIMRNDLALISDGCPSMADDLSLILCTDAQDF